MEQARQFDEIYDVVVIGAGIGGLTCGAYLAKKGKKVKVVEQHSVPGGYCTAFSRKGFKFDAAVVRVTGCEEGGALYRVLRTLETEMDFFKIDPLYHVPLPGESLVMTRDVDQFIQGLRQRFPKEKEGITALFQTMKTIYEDTRKLPALSPLLAKYKDKGFQDLMDDYVRDPVLKTLIDIKNSLWLSSKRASAIDQASRVIGDPIQGFFYPKGGTQKLSNVFAEALKRYGGELELRTLVSSIILGDGKAIGVETKDGRRIGAQQVVSNIAARATFFNLIGEEKLSPDYVATLNRNEISLSAFCVYLGIDYDPREAGITAYQSVICETLDINDVNKEWEFLLNGEFTIPHLLLMVPTLVDPSLAPPGKHIVILMAIAPYNWIGRSWREDKERMSKELIRKAEKLIPNLSQHIVVQDAATPLTLERYTLNSLGAVMGWSCSPAMFYNRLDSKTPIENLYLAGHWTRPGAGVPGVALSGLRTARLILGEGKGGAIG